ncbi:hypothetical protein [Streptomyces spectabilis]|uniref:Uncharacterized protein n=1 Tax=Streptomyces spectabilis TaxID=68270 RepID=A0A5P2XGP9_STRST|nr:hypothetical protein [Streptomyces spectabilis]MBB5109502.1 hypothetical protein [Streptomyces spectabilis]MCI3904627.1 hypothetical protein [Streptomyces spectabilis]QEV61706.1 hypothetical protein CP982_25830 [Streptomyces spectabilis]GGV54566.1 hypothetical protein GCM10010245_86240 [Streptomyces spectabilis]
MRQTQDTRWYAVRAPERPWYAVRAPERDEWWWLAPAVGTAAALLGACLRVGDGELPFFWIALTCVPGFLLVAGSWFAPRTRERRGVRVSLAAAGCVLTYLTVKVFMAALYVLAILMWLRQGDG